VLKIRCNKMLPNVCDNSLSPLPGLLPSFLVNPRLAPWAAFLRR
jgi:hypothetical protein